MSLRNLNFRHDIVKSGETYKTSLNIKLYYFQIRLLNNDDREFHRPAIHGNICLLITYVHYGWHAWMRTLTHLVLFYFMESLRVVVSLVILWKRRYQIQCERCVFGITVIRYAQNLTWNNRHQVCSKSNVE